MKTCKKCGASKEVSEFFKHKTMKDRLDSSCKTCVERRRKQAISALTKEELAEKKARQRDRSHKRYWSNPEASRKKGREGYQKNPEAARLRAYAWAKSHPESVRASRQKRNPLTAKKSYLKRNYGLTLDDYYDLLGKQGGVCAICKGDDNGKTLSVDHDHKTRTIRGLLCRQCNAVLGLMKDSVEAVQAAADYLKKHS